jgi:Holliday junction resolvase
MNSREKGKRGELEAAHFLTDQGFPARRGQQFSGSPDSPDLICESLPGIHFEVKRVQRTDLYAWIVQAKADAGGKMPVVLHRKNDSRWLVILDAEDFLSLIRESDFPKNPNEGEQNAESRTYQFP